MNWLPLLLAAWCTLPAAPAPVAAPTAPALAAAGDYDQLAPWPAVRWRDEIAEVEVGGAWYELVALDGTTGADLVGFCKKRWPDAWQKRFEEDLVEALTLMGHAPGSKVTLDLIDLANRKQKRVADVAMTKENRKQLWSARSRSAPQPPRPRGGGPGTLPRADALADLDELARLLREEYAYWARASKPFERELAVAQAALPEQVALDDFALRVQALLAELGDGHTQMLDLEEHLPRGWLPFLVGDAGGKLVAFRSERGGFVDEQRPFLVALDGVPIERWLAAAARLVPKGSPDFVRWHSIRNLRFVAWLRQELALPAAPKLAVELADAKGRPGKLVLDLAASKPIYGDWPRGRSRKLDDDVGLLRIAAMDDDPAAVATLHAAMQSLARSRALVIDVRGNGGGSRLLLRELFPCFMREADEPRIANVAAFRRPAGSAAAGDEGWLADRWLFPLTSREWRTDERRQLTAFAKSFRPAWTPPPADFSAWHYFLLRPALMEGLARFEGPVAVLQDGGCFSATDIFLAAFKGWRNVTLVGTRSGGGSGRAIRRELRNSRLEFRASTMASFRADGSLYDGVGVEPDVVVPCAPGDFVGRADAQLDAAVALLRKKIGPGKR